MRYLLDTNILLRVAQPNHPMNRQARDCIRQLLRRKDTVQIVAQVMFEFWVVATRPVANNGLGLGFRRIVVEFGALRPRSITTNHRLPASAPTPTILDHAGNNPAAGWLADRVAVLGVCLSE